MSYEEEVTWLSSSRRSVIHEEEDTCHMRRRLHGSRAAGDL